MAELKTKENAGDVLKFINSVENETRRKDALALLPIFKEVTGYDPRLWGTSIVGYGKYHYKSDRSKQEGDWPLTGFSPRKTSLTIYVMTGFEGTDDLLSKLGKHKKSVGCLYINKLSDVDEKVLTEIIKKSFVKMKKDYNVK